MLCRTVTLLDTDPTLPEEPTKSSAHFGENSCSGLATVHYGVDRFGHNASAFMTATGFKI